MLEDIGSLEAFIYVESTYFPSLPCYFSHSFQVVTFGNCSQIHLKFRFQRAKTVVCGIQGSLDNSLCGAFILFGNQVDGLLLFCSLPGVGLVHIFMTSVSSTFISVKFLSLSVLIQSLQKIAF